MAAFEVIALDTATPQLRAPGASDTYTFPRAVEMPLGTANGVLYLNGSKVATSGSALTFDGTGQLVVNRPSGSAGLILQSNDASTSYLFFGDQTSASVGRIEYDHGTNAMPFFANGSEQMRLTSTGLGIGTSSWPTAQRLRVAGGDVGFEGQFLYLVNANANIQLGASQNSRIINTDSTNTLDIGRTGASSIITFSTAGSERARITSSGNVVAGGSAALATNATDGFLYVPTCAGTPTGTPTAINGMAPIVVNTTNNKLYFYSGGAWRDAGP